MATFKAFVTRVEIEEHTNADALEIARVRGYTSVVRKGLYTTGDLVVFIPPQALLPEWLIDRLGLTGKLAGPDANRVHPVKLRGQLSQGVVYPVEHERSNTGYSPIVDVNGKVEYVTEGQDVTDILGIVKWEPPVPAGMEDHAVPASGKIIKFDVEDLKLFPTVFDEGEDSVVITEKIHGTCCIMGYHPEMPTFFAASKGIAKKQLAFVPNAGAQDPYTSMMLKVGLVGDLLAYIGRGFVEGMTLQDPFYILGEIYGAGVQDLRYQPKRDSFLETLIARTSQRFAVFDIYFGQPGEGRYLSWNELEALINKVNPDQIQTVPVLYKGPYHKHIVEDLTDGFEQVTGDEVHIREGVVIRSATNRWSEVLGGRAMLKSVSEQYLTRKGGTEYN